MGLSNNESEASMSVKAQKRLNRFMRDKRALMQALKFDTGIPAELEALQTESRRAFNQFRPIPARRGIGRSGSDKRRHLPDRDEEK